MNTPIDHSLKCTCTTKNLLYSVRILRSDKIPTVLNWEKPVLVEMQRMVRNAYAMEENKGSKHPKLEHKLELKMHMFGGAATCCV